MIDPLCFQIECNTTTNVNTLQLKLFKEYKAKLGSSIGGEEADNQIKNIAAFLVNCAENDFLITYYGPGKKVLNSGWDNYMKEFVLQFSKRSNYIYSYGFGPYCTFNVLLPRSLLSGPDAAPQIGMYIHKDRSNVQHWCTYGGLA